MPQPSPLVASPAYVRFRESHHAVARWFAQGLTISNVAEKTGYTRRRLHILLGDPTFQELIASYNAELDAEVRKDLDVYDDLQRRNMIRAEMLIQERLDEPEEPLPLLALDRISQSRADRTGYSKHNTVKHEYSFADLLDRAIERSNTARVIEHIPPQIEAQSPPTARQPQVAQEASGAEPHPSGPAPPKPSFKRVLTKKS